MYRLQKLLFLSSIIVLTDAHARPRSERQVGGTGLEVIVSKTLWVKDFRVGVVDGVLVHSAGWYQNHCSLLQYKIGVW